MHTHETRLAVRPWKRFGQDRLYVTDVTGMQIGYWDNLSATAVPDDAGRHDEIVDIVHAYWAAIRQTPAAVPAPRSGGVGRAGAAAPWTDLARPPLAPPRRGGIGGLFDRIGRHDSVRSQLEQLRPVWQVLHDVPVGRGACELQHVVIGPAGVFVISVKEHADARVVVRGDTFLVNNYAKRYVPSSRAESETAAAALAEVVGFPVLSTGVVVVVGARRGLDIVHQPSAADVVVVPAQSLGKWLKARPVVLDQRQVAAVFTQARRSAVWAPTAQRQVS